jgi:RNA polymerase sigma-70 factor (ECF subfamily)
VIAVFEDSADPTPSNIMWLEWRDGRISFIRDYRYVRYVTAVTEGMRRNGPCTLDFAIG